MGSGTLFLFLENVWSVTLALSFWLLAGSLVAGFLRVFVPNDFIERHLGSGKGVSGVLKAVLLGVPMPLCSCGVIPAALGIKKQGAGDGAAMGFLISTPQTGVDSIMVSASLLGLPFAIFKLLSAFILGIAGGIWAMRSGGGERNGSTGKGADAAAPSPPTAAVKSGKRLWMAVDFAIDDLLKMIWKWLVAGILVSAAISTWLPSDFFKTHLPGNGGVVVSMLVVLLISLPMYVCATASAPIAAALVHSGMPAGAALVFLMAGPASNVATIGAVYKTFGHKKLLVYLTTIICGSLLGGYFFDAVVATSLPAPMALADKEPSILKSASAILLLALLARFAWMDLAAFLRGKRAESSTAGDDVERLTLNVTGLTCAGCAAKLRGALEKVEGVEKVEITLKTGEAVAFGKSLDTEILERTILITGYGVSK